MLVLAIDPGNKVSAFVVWNSKTKKIYDKGIVENLQMLAIIESFQYHIEELLIEMIASYGMPVGAEVFETCIWISRYYQKSFDCYGTPKLVYRKDIKMHHCLSNTAKDSNIIQALKDKYGDKGTKKNPGIFYEFKDDIWQAFALASYWTEKNHTDEKETEI